MPINASIPLQVQGIDPNGFTNAFAAGMKMREVQNASARLARKDELAEAKTNALSTYGAGPRGPQDRAAVWAVDPVSGMALDKAAAESDKNTTEAAYNKVRTDKLTSEATEKKVAVISQLLTSATDQPSYEQVYAQVLEIEPNAKWPERYDPAFVEITKRRALKLVDQLRIDMDQTKANKPDWVESDDGWVDRKTLGGPTAPTAPPAGPEPTAPPTGPPMAPPRRPTMVPGGSSGYSADEITAEIERLDQGGAPSPNLRMSRESLGQLLEAQTDLDNLGGGAPAVPPPDATMPPSAVPGSPSPVGDQPPPVGGPPMTRNQRQDAKDQRQAAKDAETQRIAQETLQLRKDEHAAREKGRIEKRQVQTGQRLTAADASKVQQKLVRVDAFKRQLVNLRATYDGTKDEKGKQLTKGIKGTFSAGPGANWYAPDLLSEGGEKWNKALASVVSSKTALLRTPGVGTMTDLDQMIDMADLPSRNTHEATTEQQLVALENLVNDMETGYRALLAGPAEAPAEPGPAGPPAAQTTPLPSPNLPATRPPAAVNALTSMPKPQGQAGKWLTMPDGTVYRSDGSQWMRQ